MSPAVTWAWPGPRCRLLRAGTQSTERCSRRLCTTCSLFCRSAKLFFSVCFSAGRMARSDTGIGLRIRLAGAEGGQQSQGLLSAVPHPLLLAGAPPILCPWTHHFLETPLVGTLESCIASWSLGKEEEAVSPAPPTPPVLGQEPHWALTWESSGPPPQRQPGMTSGSFPGET